LTNGNPSPPPLPTGRQAFPKGGEILPPFDKGGWRGIRLCYFKAQKYNTNFMSCLKSVYNGNRRETTIPQNKNWATIREFSSGNEGGDSKRKKAD
jgi:hypothetical protein